MFRPDETAKDLFRRLTLPTINFSFGAFNFGDICEVQVEPTDISQAALSIVFDFFLSCDKGYCYHASSGNNLYYSLIQSGLNIQGTPLMRANDEDRIQLCQVFNIQQLSLLFHDLIEKLHGKPTLLILETMSPVLYTEKSNDNKNTQEQNKASSSSSSNTKEMLSKMLSLCSSQNIIILWITAASPRHGGSLRDASCKDAISSTWRKTIPKTAIWKPPQ